jgi:CHASE3 domain sensor protein
MLMPKLLGVLAAVATCIGLLVTQTVLLDRWQAIHEERDRQLRIKHEVLRLERLVTDVDNGFRGYVLMKQAVFLGPMIAAEGKIPGVVEGLGRMTEEWPALQGLVRVLNDRVTELLDVKRRLTLELERGDEEGVLAYIRGGEGLALANTITLLLQDLSRKLEQQEADLNREAAKSVSLVRWGLAATAVGGVVCGVGIGRATSRSGRTMVRKREPVDQHDLLGKSPAVRPGDIV